jgi:hypothetical protein
MAAPWRFSCAYNGQCEESIRGTYDTLADCQEHCRSAEDKELQYLVDGYNFDFERVLDLAPANFFYTSHLEAYYPRLRELLAQKYDPVDRFFTAVDWFFVHRAGNIMTK